MKPSSATLSLVIVMVVAAACGVASTPAAIDTATPPATRTPTAPPSPTLTSTPDAEPEASATAPLPLAALPACRQPSQVELGQLTLAFIADWDGDSEVYLIQADGSGLVQLTDNNTSEDGPKWSPDGQRLALVNDFLWNPRLMVVDADGSNASSVAPNLEVSSDLVWSPTGRQIVLRSVNDLYSVDVETGVAVNLTRGLAAGLPSFSPEGDRMVIGVKLPLSAGTPRYRLFTVGTDGTNLTEFSFAEGDAKWPRWHPMRPEILFEGIVQGEGIGLYVLTLDAAIRKLQSEPKYLSSLPSWSPDGTMIAYVVSESDPGPPRRPLHALHVATANEDVDEIVLDPAVGGDDGLGIYRYYWAPDSRHIAYTVTNESRGFGTADVFVFDICEGEPRMVVEAVSQFSDISWRPLP